MKIGGSIWLICLSWLAFGQAPPKLLILTTSEFSTTAQAIQQHKTTFGITTHILLSEEVNGFPSPEELQAAIRKRHIEESFDHLLILGDAQHIPPFSGIQGTWHDHGYSLLNDDDYLPDIAVGRLSFADDQAASMWWQHQVDKRQSLYDGRTALVSVSALNRDDEEGLMLTDTLINRGLSVALYRQTQQTNDGQSILHQLESGTAWSIYYGHGDAVGWNSLQPGISVGALENLQLATPTMILSAACDNANFAYTQGPSLGEEMVRAGAMGFVGCTGQCLYDYSDTVTKYTLFRYLEKPYRTIGQALQEAKYDAYDAFHQQSATFTELTLQHFVLLGDPTAMPPTTQLQKPSISRIDNQVCLNEEQVFWRWREGEICSSSGFARDNHCFDQPVNGSTLTVMGRQVAPGSFDFTPTQPSLTLYPNPIQAGQPLQIQTTSPIEEAHWVSTQGQLLRTTVNAYQLIAPGTGVWQLTITLEDGTLYTSTLVVLP